MSERGGAQPGGVSDELAPYVDAGEAKGIDQLGERLKAERPAMPGALRAELRAELADSPAAAPWRPRNLPALVAAYLLSGLGLLGVAAIGALGAGPFG